MKMLLLSMIAILSIGTTTIASSHKQETVRPETIKRENFSLRYGNQKRLARGELTVRFVSVLEDSRCPIGVNCVWAGNAKIQVRVTDRRSRSRVLELNTGGEPRSGQFGNYAITLVDLTPQPTQNSKPMRLRYFANFSITRLSR